MVGKADSLEAPVVLLGTLPWHWHGTVMELP